MFTRVVGRPRGWYLLGVLVLWVAISTGQSQEKQLSNSADLGKEYNQQTEKRRELITGARQPQGKEDQHIMDVTARWSVQRVTWTSPKNNKDEMAKIHEELDRLTKDLFVGKNNKAFIDQLGKPLAMRLKEVFALSFADNRMAVLNAALMLPTVAKLKQEDIGDLLVELLNDNKQHDAVKLYAAKAMREFFPAQMWTVNVAPGPKTESKFKRDSARLKALVDYIGRQGAAAADEDERDVCRYLRREAVSSLAQVGVPALKALKKNGGVQGPAAYELLRVLLKGKDAYDPPTTLSERVEAACGLCQLIDGGNGEYDPTVAIYAVGLCFLDYATEYSTDYVHIAGRKEKNAKADSKIPTMAWKVQSERFKQAAKAMVMNIPRSMPPWANQNPKESAVKLDKEIVKIADAIKTYNRVDDELRPFRVMVQALAPKTGRLYELKGPQVDPASLQGGAPAANGN